MAEVTYTNLLSQSRENVLALISSKTNVVDPTTTASEFRKWIYSREPDIKATDFKGWPYIILNPAVVSFSDAQSLDGKKKRIYWSFEVEIVASDRGFNNQDGKGLIHIDAISDDILQTFNNITNRTSLSSSGMKFSKCDVTTVVPEVLDNNLIYRRSIILSFNTRKAVSA